MLDLEPLDPVEAWLDTCLEGRDQRSYGRAPGLHPRLDRHRLGHGQRLFEGFARGVALARGGDWYGAPVNLASRISDVTPPGAILASEDVKEAWPSERWEFAGAERLKGVSEPVRLWRLEPKPPG